MFHAHLARRSPFDQLLDRVQRAFRPNHWARFRKERAFLIRYFSSHLLLLVPAVVALHAWAPISAWTFEPTAWHLLLLAPAVLVGIWVPVVFHNCMHRNLRSRVANTIVAELTSFYALLSTAAFQINHIMHHAHPDTDLDPHNPDQRGFAGFFFSNSFGGGATVQKQFLSDHGDTRASRAIFAASMALHFANVLLRLFAWLLLFGPTLFVTFFLPSYLVNMFVFAHVNYVTHETLEDGTVVLYNRDSNLYYRFVNSVGSGVYYHKNHHANTSLYNPQRGPSASRFVR